MTHNQRFRVSVAQVRKQPLQRLLLGGCPGVHGSLAVGSQAADIAYSDEWKKVSIFNNEVSSEFKKVLLTTLN